ncbi:alpha/beta fold hydrolase [Curvibacter sp. PAE-UM]|uniref:alpha/beta fold hydrolase n=1 Tax=Curvibacter sp. PAE-UM TaxID=1714344 RepID=UPI00070F5C00|nr:alpha/beta hydrolase [Curvibacter sp. PAE-UM]KRI01242.1 alpha/beta hydrolase [Curvibacter sp. PAE-UM]
MSTTLMLLPGLNCDAAVWAPQVAALQGQANCVIPAWGLRDSLPAMAQQVLDEAPTERFCVAGHSMGGRVALEVMRLAPQRVERLALLDTGTHPLAAGEAGEKEKAGRMALLKIAQAQGMRVMAQEWAKGMVHPDRIGGPIFEEVLAMFERGSAAQYAAQINALLNRFDAAPLLPGITCPTLVLTGRQDAWSGPAQHEAMAAAIPGAQLVIVENSGHMTTMEQPQAVSAALADWLRR